VEEVEEGRNQQRQSMQIRYLVSSAHEIRESWTYLEGKRVTFGVDDTFVGVKTLELDETPRWAGEACCAREADPIRPKLLDAGGLVA
jgi:hypothetical protein